MGGYAKSISKGGVYLKPAESKRQRIGKKKVRDPLGG